MQFLKPKIFFQYSWLLAILLKQYGSKSVVFNFRFSWIFIFYFEFHCN